SHDLLFLHDADMDWPTRSLNRPDASLSIGVKGGITGLKGVLNSKAVGCIVSMTVFDDLILGKIFHPFCETRYVWINICRKPVHRYYDVGSVQYYLARLANVTL